MRKPELAAAIAAKAEISKDKAGEVLNVVLDQIVNACIKRDGLTLVGFGSFQVKTRNERQGLNPKTGEPITIPSAKVVSFKPGKALKDAVNS